MAAHPTFLNRILLATLAIGCASEPHLGEPVFEPFLSEYLDEGIGIRDPEWIDIGPPKSTNGDVPFFPNDYRDLAECPSGMGIPECRPGRRCLGWARYSFEVDEAGAPTELLFAGACPFPIIEEPFRAALKKWRFAPWRGDIYDGVYSTTTMAYPIDISQDATRRITIP